MNAFKLARWFTPPRDVNGPEDDDMREAVLADIAQAVRHGVGDDLTEIVQTQIGAALLSTRMAEGVAIVVVNYVRDDRWEHISFWMNASSIAPIRERVRMSVRVPFDDIFVGLRQEVEPRMPISSS